MLKRRKWVIVAIVAAVVILLTGVIGGIVYAADPTPTPTATSTPQDTLMARVASILGIDQAKLESAFTQAQKEMRDEQLTKQLDALVAAGKLTQAQADQYKQWVESRPDMPNLKGLPGLGIQGKMGMRGGFRCGPGMMNAPRIAPPTVTQ